MIIEECGSGGTSVGTFHRHLDVAWVELHHDTSMPNDPLVATLVSVKNHEPQSDIYVDSLSVYDNYTGDYLGRGRDWHDAVTIALGSHRYGYTWYQVKGKSHDYIPEWAR